MNEKTSAAEKFLAAADVARSAGDIEGARAAYVRAYDAGRASADSNAMSQAALGLASSQMFGTVPGRLPAFLHEAYSGAEGLDRARLAVAIARAWVYGGDPTRAVEFAAEAITAAEDAGDQLLLAHALDAQLLVHWGPDDLQARLAITKRLEDTVSHLDDVEARMTAYLWRLTTAMECLDLPALRRQVRALDLLATESDSDRVKFFAASRRGMHALLSADPAAARAELQQANDAGYAAGEADRFAIEHVLTSGIARQEVDRDTLVREAEEYEQFGVDQAMPSVLAEASNLWLEADRLDRTRTLLSQVAGHRFETIAHDVDWLLSITCLTRAAAAVGDEMLCAAAIELLAPYAGRGVANGGGVAFHGVVDHFLMLACETLGREDAAVRWRASAAAAYERFGAVWWAAQLDDPFVTRRDEAAHFHPVADGLWQIGAGHSTLLREMKGLAYLRLLLQAAGLPLRATDLSDAVAGHSGTRIENAGLEVIDRAALVAYRRRLAELDDEIAEAEQWADSGRTEHLHVEREALLEEVARATGLGGRSRRTSATDERARVAVRKAISAALAKIGDVDPALARLLADTVRTGYVCSYEPDPERPVNWILDQHAGDAFWLRQNTLPGSYCRLSRARRA